MYLKGNELFLIGILQCNTESSVTLQSTELVLGEGFFAHNVCFLLGG